VAAAVPYDSMEALKAAARDLSVILGSGVIALGLDTDEPQLFVTVSDDLVARGFSAGDLVTVAMPALGGRGGGRPAMAQGRGTRRDGLPDALEAITTRLATGAPGA
jgi:alanyl-tRNA synthetase